MQCYDIHQRVVYQLPTTYQTILSKRERDTNYCQSSIANRRLKGGKGKLVQTKLLSLDCDVCWEWGDRASV